MEIPVGLLGGLHPLSNLCSANGDYMKFIPNQKQQGTERDRLRSCSFLGERPAGTEWTRSPACSEMETQDGLNLTELNPQLSFSRHFCMFSKVTFNRLSPIHSQMIDTNSYWLVFLLFLQIHWKAIGLPLDCIFELYLSIAPKHVNT